MTTTMEAPTISTNPAMRKRSSMKNFTRRNHTFKPNATRTPHQDTAREYQPSEGEMWSDNESFMRSAAPVRQRSVHLGFGTRFGAGCNPWPPPASAPQTGSPSQPATRGDAEGSPGSST